MSSASDQKLFCEACSAFNCFFDEFVGEKVVSPSYSSAILAPPSCVAILILKMEERSNIFSILCLLFQKVKIQLKHRFVQCVEKVLWLTVSKVCEVSHCRFSLWMMLHVQVDQLKLIVIKLRTIQCYTMQEIANILKISKLSVESHQHQLCYDNRFDT